MLPNPSRSGNWKSFSVKIPTSESSKAIRIKREIKKTTMILKVPRMRMALVRRKVRRKIPTILRANLVGRTKVQVIRIINLHKNRIHRELRIKSKTHRRKIRKAAIPMIRPRAIQAVIRLSKTQTTQKKTIRPTLPILHPIRLANLAVQTRSIRNQVTQVLEIRATIQNRKNPAAIRAMKNRPTLLQVSPVANNPSQAMNRQVINHPVIRHPVIHRRRQRNRVDLHQGRTLVKRESRGSQAALLMTRILVRPMVKRAVVKQARATLA